VDGVTYDVKFYNSPFDPIYSSTAPTFLGNSGGAAEAASVLASALTSFSVTQLVGIGPQNNALLVPFSDARTGVLPCAPCSGYNVSYVAFQSPYVAGTWTTVPPLPVQGESNISGSNDSVTYSCCDYVVFAPSNEIGNIPAVPEPSTWAMMILGFLGIGYMAYRAKTPVIKRAPAT
jgi:PEP-CTERM motif